MDIKSQLEKCINFFQAELTLCTNQPELNRFRDTFDTLLSNIKKEILNIPKKVEVLPKLNEYLSYCDNPEDKESNLSVALKNISKSLDWYKILKGADLDKNLVDGLLATQIYGPRGLIKSNNLYFGLFLIAPNVFYPLHQHEALELYYVCSGDVKISHGTKKNLNKLESGDFSLTPSNQIHSLETTSKPCLLSYIWLPNEKSLLGKSWWWVKNKNKEWSRVLWKRNSDSTWKIINKEIITEKIFKESGFF